MAANGGVPAKRKSHPGAELEFPSIRAGMKGCGQRGPRERKQPGASWNFHQYVRGLRRTREAAAAGARPEIDPTSLFPRRHSGARRVRSAGRTGAPRHARAASWCGGWRHFIRRARHRVCRDIGTRRAFGYQRARRGAPAHQPRIAANRHARPGNLSGDAWIIFAGEHANSFYDAQGFMEGAAISGIAAANALL